MQFFLFDSDYDTVFPDVNCIGRRDLDPLAAIGGGGMLFDPLRENRNRILGDIGMPQRLPRYLNIFSYIIVNLNRKSI